jgi:hypothetical protein
MQAIKEASRLLITYMLLYLWGKLKCHKSLNLNMEITHVILLRKLPRTY